MVFRQHLGQHELCVDEAGGASGSYQVRVTDSNLCQALSTPLTLPVIPRPEMRFDSLVPVCATRTEPLLLVASPAGGTFSGPGVTGNQFDATKSRGGLHTVTYTYAGTSACPVTISRQIRVEPPAEINLPERVTVLMDNSVTLRPTIKDNLSASSGNRPKVCQTQPFRIRTPVPPRQPLIS
jgi:hypothetical protein